MLVSHGVNSEKPKSSLAQFFILIQRQIHILLRDRTSLALMLLAPALVGCFDWLVAGLLGRSPFDYEQGKAFYAAISLFLLSLYALIVGVMSQMREFVKERPIYRSERIAGLSLGAYLGSKIVFAGVLALYQGTIFTVFHYLAFDMPGGTPERRYIFLTLCVACYTAMMLGLLVSACAPKVSVAPFISLAFILLGIFFSNILVQLPAPFPMISPVYWSFKNLVAASGLGTDVAEDDCWKFPAELRTALTLEDKIYFHCSCMGLAMFSPDSCNFPGIGQFYQPALAQDPPNEPIPSGLPPPEPDLPTPPTTPEDPDDYAANAIYLQNLQNYRNQVAEIQKNYQLQVIAYQLRAELYRSQMAVYRKNLITWQNERTSSVSAAESLVSGMIERFGWAFVSREKQDDYIVELGIGWIGPLFLCLFMSMLIIIILRRQG